MLFFYLVSIQYLLVHGETDPWFTQNPIKNHPSSGPGHHLIIHHHVITFIQGMWSPIPPISNLVDLVDLERGCDESYVLTSTWYPITSKSGCLVRPFWRVTIIHRLFLAIGHTQHLHITVSHACFVSEFQPGLSLSMYGKIAYMDRSYMSVYNYTYNSSIITWK